MLSFGSQTGRRVTLGAQGVVCNDIGQVLLIRHTYQPGWHFPGGGVERGEAMDEALARELREEANVSVSGAPQLFGLYTHFDVFPGDHIALYRVTSWTRLPGSFPTREIAECGFFDRQDLPEGVTKAVRSRLAEIFDGTMRSKAW
jgi:8-oxo-dGTP pyrophosphatase MutT (NUDIX family)